MHQVCQEAEAAVYRAKFFGRSFVWHQSPGTSHTQLPLRQHLGPSAVMLLPSTALLLLAGPVCYQHSCSGWVGDLHFIVIAYFRQHLIFGTGLSRLALISDANLGQLEELHSIDQIVWSCGCHVTLKCHVHSTFCRLAWVRSCFTTVAWAVQIEGE